MLFGRFVGDLLTDAFNDVWFLNLWISIYQKTLKEAADQLRKKNDLIERLKAEVRWLWALLAR